MSEQTEEIDLIRRINARDQQALSAFYERFANLVYGLALRIVQNTSLAEEIMQDTFLKVWNQAHRWDPERGSIVTWLMTITRYTGQLTASAKKKRPGPPLIWKTCWNSWAKIARSMTRCGTMVA
jgi:DNA-directed RNA polymerase specialized sigma24 family protein